MIPALLALACAGCRPNMKIQQKYTPLERSWFFKDERSARPIPPGAVSVTEAALSRELASGAVNGAPATTIPLPVTPALLGTGEEQFNIYCRPCHGRSGAGDGIIVRHGFQRPPDLRAFIGTVPPGFVYGVIVNGTGAMLAYGYMVRNVQDRWAIVAYARTLGTAPAGASGAPDQPPEMEKSQ